MGYETFAGRICELAGGAVVSPGRVVPWLDEGWVEGVVFDGPSRVIDVGVRRRIFFGAARRAFIVSETGSASTTTAKCPRRHVRSTTSRPGPPVA
ncbi:MAG: hypothetical protein ACR2HY_11375 [Acidimicrobiales bacterium]